jgi:hypothetical protein
VVDPVLDALRALGIERSMMRRLVSGRVLAAAFVLLACQERGIRKVTPLLMEALVRLCEDRDQADPPSLEDKRARAKVRDAWKKVMRKGRSLLPLLMKVGVTQDAEPVR